MTISLTLRIFDCPVSISCIDQKFASLIEALYGHFRTTDTPARLRYFSDHCSNGAGYILARDNQVLYQGANESELIYQLEKDLTTELQKIRTELFFLHGAAVGYGDKAIVFIAPPGSGKSTTTWGLLHHDFIYLSDELAPVDLEDMAVWPYPHALCLKQEPPSGFPLPPATRRTPRTLHVPAQGLPVSPPQERWPVSAVFHVRYDPRAVSPNVTPVSAAEASSLIYANGLNQLAHEQDGLDAAVRIASHAPAFRLDSANLADTCELLKEMLSSQASSD